MEKKDLFILADGPVNLVKVGEENGFCKLHFNGEMEFGDFYHTMHELYEHRMALNVALFNVIFDKYRNKDEFGLFVYKSKLHHDGTMFEGYFIVALTQNKDMHQISYHYDIKHWNLFEIPEVERIPFEYDGHTPKDVVERLLKL